MSEIAHNKAEVLSFIGSEKFGMDAWTTLYHFGLNTQNIILTIELYGVLIEKLDTDNLLANHNIDDMVRIKQHIVLDVIMKTQILIESTLVLIHCLSTGYRTLARNMTYYDMNLVDSIINEIRKNKKMKNYKYNMRKVLGLPNLKLLDLSSNEKKFLNQDFQKFESDSLARLRRQADFYDKFRVVYGKTKHGLAFLTAGTSISTVASFEDSILQCFGRRIKEPKHPNVIRIPYFKLAPEIAHDFFDFISIVKFGKQLIDEINATISNLKEIISFICTNHKSFALNCGKGYLPYTQRNGRVYMLTSMASPTENEQKIIESIASKNLKQMYIPTVEFSINNE